MLVVFINSRKAYFIFSIFILIVTACSSGSNNANTDEGIVSVPFEVDEILFMSSLNVEDCYDNLGGLTASAYIFKVTGDLPFEGGSFPDDIDGISPDPIISVNIAEYDNGIYMYEVDIQDPGSYRTTVTCQSDLDDPATDDNIRFIHSSIFFRVENIPDNFSETPFPEVHPSTTTECLGCHRVTQNYDVAILDHLFILPRTCLECHSPVLPVNEN